MEIEEKTKRDQRAKRAMPALEVGGGNGPLYRLFQFHHDLCYTTGSNASRKREERNVCICIYIYKIRIDG